VEAGLFERLERGEHVGPARPVGRNAVAGRIWLAAAAFAAAAAVLVWWRFEPAPAPLAAGVSTGAPAEVAAALERPVREQIAHIVTTGAPTRTTIGEATLTLAALSEVRVSGSDADGWLVQLEAGQVDCEVAPRRGRPAFVVQSGETEVSVIGTSFSVTREGFGARVRVREGSVRIASGATQLSLGAGEEWPLPSALEPALDLSELEPLELESLELEPARDDARSRSKKARRAVRTPAAADQFEAAARLEAKDPGAAIEIYRDLARGKGHWAANALYAQARLEFERGQTARAQALLRRYLARYPKGLNAADVRSLMKRISALE
jgi:hypothetical protein